MQYLLLWQGQMAAAAATLVHMTADDHTIVTIVLVTTTTIQIVAPIMAVHDSAPPPEVRVVRVHIGPATRPNLIQNFTATVQYNQAGYNHGWWSCMMMFD